MHFTFSLFNKLKPEDVEFGVRFRQVFGVAAGLKNTTVWDFYFFFFFNTVLDLKVALPDPH